MNIRSQFLRIIFIQPVLSSNIPNSDSMRCALASIPFDKHNLVGDNARPRYGYILNNLLWTWRFQSSGGFREYGAGNIFGALVWKFLLTKFFFKLSFVKILMSQGCALLQVMNPSSVFATLISRFFSVNMSLKCFGFWRKPYKNENTARVFICFLVTSLRFLITKWDVFPPCFFILP